MGDLSFPTIPLAELDPSVLQAGLVLIFVFIMATMIGLSRRFLFHYSMQGAWMGFIAGIITLLMLEAGLFVGYREVTNGRLAGKTPENLKLAVDKSRQNVSQVLGLSDEEEKIPTAQSVFLDYKNLPKTDAELVQTAICSPDQ